MVKDNLRTIDESFKTAVWSYEQRLVAGTNRVIDYDDFTNSSELAQSQLFFDFNKKMDSALDRLDREGVASAIRFLKEGIKNRPQTSGHEILQMTKEVCNLFIFSVRKNKFLMKESNFFEEFSSSANNFGSINSLFHHLTNSILELLDKIIADKKQMDTKPIRDAKQYIKDNYQHPITLEEVSGKIGFNPTYFSSLFKKDTGSTFLEYLSEIRMNEAKNLLKETNLGVVAICESVGYNDVKHFTKVFRKTVGLKPNEYRKLYS